MQPPPPGPPPPWEPPPEDYGSGGQQPPAYGPPPQWATHSQPVPAPTSQQAFGGISLAVIGLLGLLGAILTLTLWINLHSAESRAADMCNRFRGSYASACRQQVHNMVPAMPTTLVVCLFLIIAACLAVAAGAVMLFLRRPLGQFLILGGGIVMLVLSIAAEARYGATGRVTYDLIAGLIIAVIGGLLFIPAFRVLLGLPPQLTTGPGGHPAAEPWPPSGPPQSPPYSPPGPPQQW